MVDRNKLVNNISNIPEDLKNICGWCGFKIEDAKKTPISILDFRKVGATDTDRLVDFQTAVQMLINGKVDAIGVSLNEGCGIVSIDVDCHEEAKRTKYDEIRTELVTTFNNTYIENSISGLGTHIFLRGTKPIGYKNKDKFEIVEIYDTAHFVIPTGDILENKPADVTNCQDELTAICEKYLQKIEIRTGSIAQNLYDIEDEQVIEKINTLKKGVLFLTGNWQKIEKYSKYDSCYVKAYNSQSEADFAFLSLILYTNGNNVRQAERLFKQSVMYRPNQKSAGYVTHQAAEASLRLTQVYDWKKINNDNLETDADAESTLTSTADNNSYMQSIRQYGFTGCISKKLNEFVTKYMLLYGGGFKDVTSTALGDLDNAVNGQRFYILNKNELIYVEDGKEWLKWNGKFWVRCYDDSLLEYAERVFTHIKHEAFNLAIRSVYESDEEAKKDLEKQAEVLFNYASSAKNKRNCTEMIDFAKSHFIKNNSYDFDNTLNVINLQNGVFDFNDMALHKHDKKFCQTKITNVEYDEKADCPIWIQTLEKLLPSAEILNYMQKVVGYTISNRNKEKALFILHGDGDNGKTTVINLLLKLMGQYSVTINPESIMENFSNKNNGPRPDLLRLRDKRFVAVSESNENDRLSEGLIKSLTGGGYITCRGLHKEPVSFVADFKLFFDTNHRPTVRGTDIAIWNRLKVIPFLVQIQAHEKDRELPSKLEKELAGILNWAIEGYKKYIEEGLAEPQEMKLIIDDYSEDMSALDQWFKECVEVTTKPTNAKNGVTSKLLYQSYKGWCEFNNEYIWTQRKFTSEFNKKPIASEVRKVKGFIQYKLVRLNNLGYLCSEKDTMYSGDFAKQYNASIGDIFLTDSKIKQEMEKLKKEEQAYNNKVVDFFNSDKLSI